MNHASETVPAPVVIESSARPRPGMRGRETVRRELEDALVVALPREPVALKRHLDLRPLTLVEEKYFKS